MVQVIKILFFCGFVAAALSAPKEAVSSVCSRDGIQVEEGKTLNAPIGKCYKITCVDAKKNVVNALNCPEFIPEPGYHLGKEDLTKPYPKCCPERVHD